MRIHRTADPFADEILAQWKAQLLFQFRQGSTNLVQVISECESQGGAKVPLCTQKDVLLRARGRRLDANAYVRREQILWLRPESIF